MKLYFNVKTKFTITLLIIILWLLVATYYGYFWLDGLTQRLPIWYSLFVIISLAIIPSVNMGLMLCGIVMDRQRNYSLREGFKFLPKVTILIAAYNEGEGIYETLKYLNNQKYRNKFYIKVIDNNSKDNTKEEIFRAIQDFPNINIEYMFQEKQGKFHALNMGLEHTNTKYVITLDADTLLYDGALYTLVNHMNTENLTKKVGAVAGSILVRNSRVNLLTKLQEWEYFLSISGIKRSQGLFQSTLVAQGAFSIFDTELVKSLGGWSDTIGEDIVLTWDILSEGYATQFEPMALGFTNVPTEYKVFFKQRARWARGMIEALKRRSVFKYHNLRVGLHVFQDFLLPLLDLGVVFALIPGMVLAIVFGDFIMFGPMVLFMLPLTAISFLILFNKEKKFVFDALKLKVRKHYISFLLFILVWNIILAPAAITGYIQEIFRLRRRWK